MGSPRKDTFELQYLRVEYQANWPNATTNAQMDVGTATDAIGWKLGGVSVVVDSLFIAVPILSGGSVFVLILLCIT